MPVSPSPPATQWEVTVVPAEPGVVISLEDVRWGGLRRTLRGLAAVPAPGEHRLLADGLLASILVALDAEDRRARRLARAGRAAVVGGVVGGVAATVGTLAVVRGRRLRPAP
jgi:hypothetical protein